MKKILTALSLFIICGAYAATHLDTENRLWFNADVVKNAIVEFVPEDKQQPTADLYQDLMDQTTGKISVDSLFKVCRKAGFNTYKYEGFTQCKSFIQKMLMDAEVAQSVDLNGFCPGLDEKGNNPNKLRSITDKTRIGDFCSSTNIRMGQVIFKPGYNCSCMASVCNPGFEFQGGACVTRIADGNGDCLREAYPKTSENNYLEKCKSFCEKKYAGRACKYTSVVMSHSTNQCICNPNSTEIDAAYDSMHQAKEKQINNLKYYEVCRGKKNSSADVCDKDTFNWVNVGRLQASGLAEEYARVRYKDTIHCDTTNTRGTIDDYVKCSSLQQKKYYEFKFDDIKESVDSDIQAGVVLGICSIHNVKSNVVVAAIGDANRYTIAAVNNRIGVLGCKTACTSDITESARRMGLTATTEGKFCILSGRSIKSKDTESKLAKIDGIDNYVFFHGIQIQGSQNVISQLRQYIKSTGKTVRTFDCIKNVGEIKNAMLVGDDDVLRCTLNGQPIDFVFEDFSESWLYVQEVGESKMQCIVSGGKFAGQECYGLTQKQCQDANATYLKQNPGASGFRWDGKECVSIDANEAQVYDGAIQIGTGAIALVDCVVGTHVGCVLVMVETAGLATEMTTGVAIENRAGEFLSVSTRCKKRDCAISTIQNAGHVLSVMGALDATSLDSVDKELARLVGYLEPEDLSGVSDGDWNAIVTQLGGDPEDAGGTALKWLNRIGLGAQFLSIGISGLRLTAQAITKLAGKGSRIGRTASTVARALDTSGDAARTVNNASDFTRAANNTSDAGRTANNASDAGRAANNASDAGRTANNASDAGRTANNASDAGRAANNAGDALHADISAYRNAANKNRARAKYHPDKFTKHSTSIQTKAQIIFQQMDNIDSMSDDELRALSRLMSEFDAEVAAEAAAKATAAAADASRATTNAATDGARTTNTTADAARTTSRATNAATDGARMFGRTNVDDIGMIDKGWERAVFDGVDRFRHKKITYPEEADDVRRALEATKGQHNLAYMGVKDGYIVIAYESDLEQAWPAFNKAVSGMTDAARTTSRTTNAATDGARMFGRTNVDNIGMVDKGWERAVFDGVDRFRHKKITYPEEADDVRRALEATKGQHNLAYMGVKDGYIVIAYESDLERAWPAFNKAVSGMTDAARTTSRTTNAATDVVRSATASKYATDADANLIAKLGGADIFDNAVDGWRRDWTDVAFPKSKLTDSEWNKLNQSLEKYNMEFVQGYFRNRPNDMTLVEYTPDNIRSLLEGKDIPTDAYGTLSSRPVSFKYIMDEAKTGREIFIDVGDAKEQVFQTFMRNNGLEYDRASKKVYNPSATPLQRAKGKLYTYGQTFNKTIDDFLYRNGGYPASWRRADLTDAEFDVLRADLRSHDLLLDTDPEGFLRISRISDSATNAAKTTSRATNAATDGARTANATADAARATNTASNNYTPIQQSLVKRLNEEMNFVGNTNDSHLIGLRNEYLQKISTVANEQEANALWLKYHDDIIDYASKQFDPYKARGIAIGRRHEYMNIIKNDPDLLAKVKKWSTLSDADKEDVLAIILLKTDTPVDISITRTGVGGSTDYNTGNIELSLNSGHVFGSNGRTHIIKPSESFDDAITALAHEHTHAILVNNPTKSSVPEDLVKTVILHNEDEKGVTSYRGIRSSMNNYLNQIQEKEAFYMSEIIGNGFTQDLLK